MRRVAAAGQVAVQLRAAGVGDDVLADDDRVAGERVGLFGCNRNQLGDPLGERPAAVVVERAGIPDRLARRKRAEARIEVIVVLVDQLQRHIARAA